MNPDIERIDKMFVRNLKQMPDYRLIMESLFWIMTILQADEKPREEITKALIEELRERCFGAREANQ